MLGDRKVRVGAGGNLGKMRNANHLRASAEALQSRTHGVCSHTADAGINLVENQRLLRFRVFAESAQGEHHAR